MNSHKYYIYLLGAINCLLLTLVLWPKISSISRGNNPNTNSFNIEALAYQINNSTISPDLLLINQDGDSTSIEMIAGSVPTLIINYSEFDCNLCFNELISIIHEVVHTKFHRRIKIIGAFESRNTYLSFINHFSTNFDIFLTPLQNNALYTQFKKTNSLYLFILDSDLLQKDPFIPNNDPERTKAYVKVIAEKYFTSAKISTF